MLPGNGVMLLLRPQMLWCRSFRISTAHLRVQALKNRSVNWTCKTLRTPDGIYTMVVLDFGGRSADLYLEQSIEGKKSLSIEERLVAARAGLDR